MRLRIVVLLLAVGPTLLAAGAEFEHLYREAVDRNAAEYGNDAPRTARSRLALGRYLFENRRAAEAEPLLKRAYEELARSGADEHGRAAEALETWAEIRTSAGDGKGARLLLERAASLREPDSDEWAADFEALGELARLLGDVADSESYFRKALRAARTPTRLRSLALTTELLGRGEEAEELFAEALSLLRQERGGMTPEAGLTLNSLGMLAVERGDTGAAIERFRAAATTFANTLGVDTPDSATALDNLGNAYRAAGQYSAAEERLRAALAIRRRVLADDHPDIATSLNNLAGVYHVQRRLADAEPLYREAIASRQRAFGPDDPGAAEPLYNLGFLLQQSGKSGDAIHALEEALRVTVLAYGPSDEFAVEIRESLAALGVKRSPSP